MPYYVYIIKTLKDQTYYKGFTENYIQRLAEHNANRNTTKKHLEALVNGKHLQKHGVGKGTWYSPG